MSVGIETKRLVFRRYSPADLDRVFELFSDAYARRFYPGMVDRDRAGGWIAWNLENYERYGFGLWAIETREDSRFVGDCGLTYQNVEGRDELEIGYHLLASERGKGFASEAARACLDYGFSRLDAGQLCSIVLPANSASCAVAGRLHAHKRSIVSRGQAAFLFHTQRTDWESPTVGR
jgi:RimJ/RimL family protein N-acetyltransferase